MVFITLQTVFHAERFRRYQASHYREPRVREVPSRESLVIFWSQSSKPDESLLKLVDVARVLGFQASVDLASTVPKFLKLPQLAGEVTEV